MPTAIPPNIINTSVTTNTRIIKDSDILQLVGAAIAESLDSIFMRVDPAGSGTIQVVVVSH